MISVIENTSCKSETDPFFRKKINPVLIMAIVNTTPDSFSGDGLFKKGLRSNFAKKIDEGVKKVSEFVKEGADIIDIGGESTRPGSRPVSVKEETRRTVSLIKEISKAVKVPISIDTYKSQVAETALKNGATIVNDISAMRFDKKMADVVRSHSVPVVLMHTKGKPAIMQKNPVYKDIIGEIISFLKKRIDYAVKKGININKIIVDPGIGFGKTVEHNLTIIRRLSEFKSLGRPILVGMSRKSFIGKVLNLKIDERVCASITSVILACINGASIVRVHDVLQTRQSIHLMERILSRADINS